MNAVQRTFAVLHASRHDEHRRWLELWEMWPDREIFAHPAYVSLFARSCDRAVCAVLQAKQGCVLFPFIVRPIAAEQWVPDEGSLFDAVSPYGYGGPFAWGCSREDAAAFWEGLRGWSRQEAMVCLFARLSLFADQLIPIEGIVRDNAPNVVRWLDIDEDRLWRDYEHKVRKNVKRAISSGLTVELDVEGRRLSEFLEIYYGTMKRRGAKEDYYFPRKFFERMCNSLRGQYMFFHVLSGNAVVSTELVLISQRHIYSFLGGTKAEAFHMRPNDLLKHQVILWGRRENKRAYVLGGGYGGADGIYRYKLSFSPQGEVWFRTGQIIFDENAYERLKDARTVWERRMGRDWSPPQGFFPEYRG